MVGVSRNVNARSFLLNNQWNKLPHQNITSVNSIIILINKTHAYQFTNLVLSHETDHCS